MISKSEFVTPLFVNDIVAEPVPSPLEAATALNLIRSVPLVKDKSFLGNDTKPVPLLSVPLVPGSPLVENATVNVTAPALVCVLVIAVLPLPFANCIVATKSVITVSPIVKLVVAE